MIVATYNIHRCVGADGEAAPQRISEVLEEIGADSSRFRRWVQSFTRAGCRPVRFPGSCHGHESDRGPYTRGRAGSLRQRVAHTAGTEESRADRSLGFGSRAAGCDQSRHRDLCGPAANPGDSPRFEGEGALDAGSNAGPASRGWAQRNRCHPTGDLNSVWVVPRPASQPDGTVAGAPDLSGSTSLPAPRSNLGASPELASRSARAPLAAGTCCLRSSSTRSRAPDRPVGARKSSTVGPPTDRSW